MDARFPSVPFAFPSSDLFGHQFLAVQSPVEALAVHNESVASLQRIVIDTLTVLPYFPGPNLAKEGDHAGTGRIPSR